MIRIGVPKSIDAWLSIALLPFKAYVATGYPFLQLFHLGCSVASSPAYGFSMTEGAILSGYVPAALVLMAGAIVQVCRKESDDSLNTFLFAVVPVVLLVLIYTGG
ncbi:MAG: hypothetical protein AB1705_02270 [Verrucomicrobiota bacterium]